MTASGDFDFQNYSLGLVAGGEIMESRHPIWWMGHTFTVVTGISFVISAILNALSFWLIWRLNYFLIASPADVVMSGFILVAAVAAVGAAVALVGLIVTRLNARAKASLERKLQEQAAAKERALAELKDMTASLVKSNLDPAITDRLIAAQRERIGEDLKSPKSKWGSEEIFMITAMIMAAVVTVPDTFKILGGAMPSEIRPIWYETGLIVSPISTKLGLPCQRAPVAWLGNSSALVECRDGLHVLHTLDDLETVQRYP